MRRGPGAERARRRADALLRAGAAHGGEVSAAAAERGESRPRAPRGARARAARLRGRGAPGLPRGGAGCPGRAAPVGSAPRMLGSAAAGCGRPCSAPGGDGRAPRAHVSPRVVAWDRSPGRRGRAAVVGCGAHVGVRRTCVDTCVAGVAIAWRGAARPCGAREGPVQRDPWLDAPERSPSPRPRRLCPRRGAAPAAGLRSPPRGGGTAGGGRGTSGRCRL